MATTLRSASTSAGPGTAADGRLSLTNRLVVALILVSSLVAILATEPAIIDEHRLLMVTLELFFAGIFLVEYVGRLWIAPISGRYGHGWRAILRYALTPAAILDFIAIAPVLLFFLSGNLFILRVARVARLVRLARLGQFSHALDNVTEAIKSRSLRALAQCHRCSRAAAHELDGGLSLREPRAAGRLRLGAAGDVVVAGNADHSGLWRRRADHAPGPHLRRSHGGHRHRPDRHAGRHSRQRVQRGDPGAAPRGARAASADDLSADHRAGRGRLAGRRRGCCRR